MGEMAAMPRTALRRTSTIVTALTLVLGLALPASAMVEIHRIRYNPSGPDTRANAQLKREVVVLRNTGAKARNLGGWLIRDKANHRHRVPAGFTLRPGRYVRLHTGTGRNDANDLFWKRGWYVWNNDGDTAVVKNRAGRRIDRCTYRGGGASIRC
jgi:hypothetical protein